MASAMLPKTGLERVPLLTGPLVCESTELLQKQVFYGIEQAPFLTLRVSLAVSLRSRILNPDLLVLKP